MYLIYRFNFLPYTVELNYQPTLMRTRDEIAVVVFGPLMDVVAFSLLVVFSWLSQKIFGTFPDIFSKFVMAFGIMTFFDPLLILVVDCAQKVNLSSLPNCSMGIISLEYMNVQNRLNVYKNYSISELLYIYIEREEVSGVSVYVFAVFVMHKWI